jgi:hypothetical protein
MTGVCALLCSEMLARGCAKAGDPAGAIRVGEETAALGDGAYAVNGHNLCRWMRTQLLLAGLYRTVNRIDDGHAIERESINAIGYRNNDPGGWFASGGVYTSSVLGVVGEVGGSHLVFDAVGSSVAEYLVPFGRQRPTGWCEAPGGG